MIPKNLGDVSNEWLSSILKAEVTQLPAVQIGQGVGLMGDIYRVGLNYTGAAPAQAPASVVVKLPSSFEENREQGVALGMFEAEVRFYNEMAPEATVGLPQIYHAEIETGTADFVIVMEDLCDLTMVNQSTGMSSEQAMAVVKVLASLHAVWWNKVRDGNLDWIPDMIGPRIEFVDAYLTQVFGAFKNNFADQLPAAALAVYEKFVGNYQKINQRFASRSPWTLAHQDFRVENVMFDASGSDRVVVIDWQGIGRGPGAYDLSYILGGSMEPELRRTHEHELVVAYHNRLLECGITDYSLEQLQDDYGHAHLMGGLATSILTGGAMDLSNERGKELVATMARRHGIAAVDQVTGESCCDRNRHARSHDRVPNGLLARRSRRVNRRYNRQFRVAPTHRQRRIPAPYRYRSQGYRRTAERAGLAQ